MHARCVGGVSEVEAARNKLPEYVTEHPDTTLTEALLQGIAESLSPGILGFTMLSLAALIVALGFHRELLE